MPYTRQRCLETLTVEQVCDLLDGLCDERMAPYNERILGISSV